MRDKARRSTWTQLESPCDGQTLPSAEDTYAALKDPAPAPSQTLAKPKKYAYVFQCCACSYPSVPYKYRACPNCSHARCNACPVTKILVR
ncbi:hypothetical protein CC80DRAFT_496641 [Byssothecium circinans]|uniref:Uncharacterized protein n=1 Tax=Byssothecium circinans TaxID=147558 RepID=A0A6A5TG33_9PLEO|nr:hypothetical protein CC80DRAFT_496641 [Byssothecium circinans]